MSVHDGATVVWSPKICPHETTSTMRLKKRRERQITGEPIWLLNRWLATGVDISFALLEWTCIEVPSVLFPELCTANIPFNVILPIFPKPTY